MSVAARHILPLTLALLVSRTAMADEDEDATAATEAKTPFYGTEKDKEDGDKTAFYANITASTFFYTESGDPEEAEAGQVPYQSASNVSRVFSELRLQTRADHIRGGSIDAKLDFRIRVPFEYCDVRVIDNGNATQADPYNRCAGRDGQVVDGVEALPGLPGQSGTLGAEEYDLRELYVQKRSEKYDLRFGRQFATELAGFKFDGLKVSQNQDKQWNYFAFAGAFPMRSSRHLAEDYRKIFADPSNPASPLKRVIPIIGGAGAKYQKGRAYGSLGVGTIAPRGNHLVAGASAKELQRFFASSQGYWQQSDKTDIYHFLVLDLGGSRGAGPTNVSLGVNHRPMANLQLFAQLNRVDTETLEIHLQRRLDPQDQNVGSANLVQNNWYVSRVAQESGRAGATMAFKRNRFQVTAASTLRRRPEIEVTTVGGETVLLPLAEALDLQLRLVDRRSLNGFRIGGTVTRSAGIGDENLDRSKSVVARIDASRNLASGKGLFELYANYITAKDQTRTDECPNGTLDFLSCFGTSKSNTIGAGGMIFYRPRQKWYFMGLLGFSQQTLTTSDAMNAKTKQPAIFGTTAFARFGYRFR